MSYISVILFALSINMDNFIVGTSYGIKRVKINIRAGIVISLITMFGTILSMSFGERMLNVIPLNVASVCGGLLIISMGIFYVITYALKKQKQIQGDVSENLAEMQADSRKIAYKKVGHGRISDVMGQYAEPISAGIIILLGILEILI